MKNSFIFTPDAKAKFLSELRVFLHVCKKLTKGEGKKKLLMF